MSKDIIVIAPNGRRQKIHCTPDTIFLQVLEDVCQKQGFQPSDYDLKHHNHILDLTTTLRFSNLPNKAMLEMVEAGRKREETIVTIGLQLEDGERRTADFLPNTSLYDLVISLAPAELNSLQHPCISYMRQEVTGETALRDKTLRQLGLIKGRAILRLLNKHEEGRQANVSAVYRRPAIEKCVASIAVTKADYKPEDSKIEPASVPGPSEPNKNTTHQFRETDLITKFKTKSLKSQKMEDNKIAEQDEAMVAENEQAAVNMGEKAMEVDSSNTNVSVQSLSQENLERRLKIEEEVTFLGAQKAIAFMQSDNVSEDIDDLPDDFYDLTIEEVRRLYHDLQQYRISLENTPLLSTSKRDDLEQQASEQKLNTYKNVVVRIQFPDHIILQGIFSPLNTIEDVRNFIKEHLQSPDKEFDIFTTPLKETLDPKITLLQAKFVPCVHMHFKWSEENTSKQLYLKEEIYSKKTASDAAGILASKYRAPSRRKLDESVQGSQSSNKPSTSKSSKAPKWFKS